MLQTKLENKAIELQFDIQERINYLILVGVEYRHIRTMLDKILNPLMELSNRLDKDNGYDSRYVFSQNPRNEESINSRSQ